MRAEREERGAKASPGVPSQARPYGPTPSAYQVHIKPISGLSPLVPAFLLLSIPGLPMRAVIRALIPAIRFAIAGIWLKRKAARAPDGKT